MDFQLCWNIMYEKRTINVNSMIVSVNLKGYSIYASLVKKDSQICVPE